MPCDFASSGIVGPIGLILIVEQIVVREVIVNLETRDPER
jgi:hypothetical protein